ncbi:MAG: hypothetical protein K2Z81_26225 [Cyanobacteria bacterium]|nr:hypothetical protein [Cyanobacteriota bacterium]
MIGLISRCPNQLLIHDAIAHLTRAIDLRGDDGELWFQRAYCHAYKGDVKRAIW